MQEEVAEPWLEGEGGHRQLRDGGNRGEGGQRSGVGGGGGDGSCNGWVMITLTYTPEV